MRPTILVVIGDLDVGGTEHHLLRVLPALARQGFSPLVYTLTERLSLAPRFRAAGVEVIAPTTASAPRALPRRSRDPAPHARRGEALAIDPDAPPGRHPPLSPRRLPGRRSGGAPGRPQDGRDEPAKPEPLPAEAPGSRVAGAAAPPSHRCGAGQLTGRRARAGRRRRATRTSRAHLQRGRPGRLRGPPPRPRDPSSPGYRADGARPDDSGQPHPVQGARRPPRRPGASRRAAAARLGSPLRRPGRRRRAGAQGSGPTRWASRNGCGGSGYGTMSPRSSPPATSASCASHEEGFSNSVLEGMAAGVAMIVSDVGGNAEAVQDGVSGCVVPPRDPAALGTAILALARDPGRRRAPGGRRPRAGRRRPSAWTAAWPATGTSTSWWPAAAPTRSARRWRRSCRDRPAPRRMPA